jgi:hypothetical protein
MLVEVGGKKSVSWKHEIEFDREKLMQGAEGKLLQDLALADGRTVCTIEDLDTGAKVEGVTYRSKADPFDHVKGMKWSLKYALLAHVARADRKAFWDAFLELKKEGMQLVVECV